MSNPQKLKTMGTIQTGHEQNVVKLGYIINWVSTFQKVYNPSRNELTIVCQVPLWRQKPSIQGDQRY